MSGDWQFSNVLKCSYGFKGTILDGLADKYLIFPTDEDCLNLCLEYYSIMKCHYEEKYKDDKDNLSKVKKILEITPKFTNNRSMNFHYATYDPYRNSQIFNTIIYQYKQLEKIEDDILEKQAQEILKKQVEEQKRLLKQKHEIDNCLLNRCPTCNK